MRTMYRYEMTIDGVVIKKEDGASIRFPDPDAVRRASELYVDWAWPGLSMEERAKILARMGCTEVPS